MNFLLAHFTEVDLGNDDTGVLYVLVDGGEIVYIGQSINSGSRIAMHRLGQGRRHRVVPKNFTRAFEMRLPRADLIAFESALIRRFNPRYNGNCGADDSRDEEILARFGLLPCPDSAAAQKLKIGKIFKDSYRRRVIRDFVRCRSRRDSLLAHTLYRTAKRLLKQIETRSAS